MFITPSLQVFDDDESKQKTNSGYRQSESPRVHASVGNLICFPMAKRRRPLPLKGMEQGEFFDRTAQTSSARPFYRDDATQTGGVAKNDGASLCHYFAMSFS
jgi:hypothetical protein